MLNQLTKQISIMAATTLPVCASLIYSQDFSSNNLPSTGFPTNTVQANLGGSENLAAFGQISVASDAMIVNETLLLTSSSGFRGVGIAFSANQLVSGARYTLSVDVISFELNSEFGSNFSDTFDINVFTGNGFLPGNNNSERLFLDAQSGILDNRSGSATATEVLTESLFSFQDSPNIGNVELSFDYDGSDAVAIFLGAVSDGFPFPQITIDNITLTEVNNVPEPSSALLLSLSSLVFLRRKRNN